MLPESELLSWLAMHLVRLGPGVLFVVCLLETAVFAGLILPVGALIAFASMLASRGLFDPFDVVAVATLGAATGDQIGFVVGRWFIRGARPPRGDIARIWSGALANTEALLFSRRLVGITVGRAVPFVRTVVPWFAGRSGISWGRFLVFDLLGVALWGTIYIGGGLLAGTGWRRLAAQYGEIAGGVVVLLVVAGFLLLTRRWLQRLFRRRVRR